LSEITFSDQPFRLSGLQSCGFVQKKSLSSSAASSRKARRTNSNSSLQNSQRSLSLAISIRPTKQNVISFHNAIVALHENFNFFICGYKKAIHVTEKICPFLYLS
jgi:hypothetical protein